MKPVNDTWPQDGTTTFFQHDDSGDWLFILFVYIGDVNFVEHVYSLKSFSGQH